VEPKQFEVLARFSDLLTHLTGTGK